MKKNLDITKPRYSEQILPVPRSLIIAELSRAKRACGAPWVRKFGKLSIR